MQPAAPEPFFLLDQSLSPRLARQVFRTTRLTIATVRGEWPEKDFDEYAPRDEEIIPYLSGRAGHRGVWITADLGARRHHRELIDRHRISELWLLSPDDRDVPFYRAQQSLLLVAVVNTIRRIVAEAGEPVYLNARIGVAGQPVLERLQGTFLNSDEVWQRVPLDR